MLLFKAFVTYLLKNVEHGIEHDIEHDVDSAYGVCIYIIDIPELFSSFNEDLAIYVGHEFESLLVCNIISFICLLRRQISYKPLGENGGIDHCENIFTSFSE